MADNQEEAPAKRKYSPGSDAIEIDGTKLYSIEEAASKLSLTTRTLLTYIKSGKLKAGKIGRRWWIKEQDLNALINW